MSDARQNAGADATLAVIAHGLLNAMHVLTTSLTTVVDLGAQLPDDERHRLLAAARAQAHLVAGILQDLVRGLPPATIDVLDHLGD